MMDERLSQAASMAKKYRRLAILTILGLAVLSVCSIVSFERMGNHLAYHYWNVERRVRRKRPKKRKTRPKKTPAPKPTPRPRPNTRPRVVVRESSKSELNLVWQIAYPFSGASVTFKAVSGHTGFGMASNYGEIVDTQLGFRARFYDSIPIKRTSPNGPYKYTYDSQLPPLGSDILVKTHCSGFCMDFNTTDCMFRHYVIPLNDVREFFLSCASGSRYQSRGQRTTIVKYDPYRTRKVIFLIRNPLDILVGRWLNILEGSPGKYLMNRRGLMDFCADYDGANGSRNLFNGWYLPAAQRQATKTMCHAELYRIINFYKQGIEVRKNLVEQYEVIYFEDYATDYAGNIEKIFNILKIPMKRNRKNSQFYKKSVEDEYSFLTPNQIKQAQRMMSALIGDNQDLRILLTRYL